MYISEQYLNESIPEYLKQAKKTKYLKSYKKFADQKLDPNKTEYHIGPNEKKPFDRAWEKGNRDRERLKRLSQKLDKSIKISQDRQGKIASEMKRKTARNVGGTVASIGALVGGGILTSKLLKRKRIKEIEREIEELKRTDPTNFRLAGLEVELRRLGGSI